MNSRLPPALAALLCTPAGAGCAGAPADTALHVTFGAFVDGYYAYDFNRPPSFDRAFTTQPARHDEFNVNLAHVETVLVGPRVRGRLALQAGTSVQANYAADPTNGAVSGPELARLLQEAYAGYQLTSTLWVDGGIFYSNVGMESWVSRDNPTYTRSLVADFAPYYSARVRAVWQAMPKLAVRLDVVNGWQNISETNTDKAAGPRLDYALTSAAILSYYNFVGYETGSRLRVLNGVGVNGALTDRVRVQAQLDYGTQERDGGDGTFAWYGFTAVGRVQMSPAVALAERVERFDDDDQVLIATGAALPGFRANAASLGLDIAPHPKVLWRTEARGYQGEDAIFPDRDEPSGVAKSSAVFVTSLALTY